MMSQKRGSLEETSHVKSPPFTRRYRSVDSSPTVESREWERVEKKEGSKFKDIVEKEVRREEKEHTMEKIRKEEKREKKGKSKFKLIVEKEIQRDEKEKKEKKEKEKKNEKFREFVQIRDDHLSGLKDIKDCDSNKNCENEGGNQKKESLRKRSVIRMLSNPLSPIIARRKLSTTKSNPPITAKRQLAITKSAPPAPSQQRPAAFTPPLLTRHTIEPFPPHPSFFPVRPFMKEQIRKTSSNSADVKGSSRGSSSNSEDNPIGGMRDSLDVTDHGQQRSHSNSSIANRRTCFYEGDDTNGK